MPFLDKKDFLTNFKQVSPMQTKSQADSGGLKKPLPYQLPKKEVPKAKAPVQKQDPLIQPHLYKNQMYRELLKNPDVRKQASLESKKVWQLAKELTDEFSAGFYGSTIEPYEIKKQLYLDNLKIKHQQEQDSASAGKYSKLKRERQERSLMEKVFGLKKK